MKLSKQQIKALVNNTAGAKDNREILQCALFERLGDHVYVIASDGKKLIAVKFNRDYLENDGLCDSEQVLIHADDLKAAAAAAGKDLIEINFDAGTIGRVKMQSTKHLRYPDWRRVIGDVSSRKPGIASHANLAMIGEIDRDYGLLKNEKDCHLTGYTLDDDRVLLMGDGMAAIVMPFAGNRPNNPGIWE